MSNSPIAVRKIHIDDTLTAIRHQLKRENKNGVLAAVNLTGLTVEFKMLAATDNSVKIAQTATGITVLDAEAGDVQYAFSAAGVDTAGEYKGYFVVTSGSNSDTFPENTGGLVIKIQAD